MAREIRKQDFRRINEYLWELPTSFDPRMNVPVRIYADEELLEDALGDLSVHQAVNAASLPGLVGAVVVMPDVHMGYGFPIGGVMASKVPGGIISPGAIGYDINCLTGDARILHRFGYTRAIQELAQDWSRAELICYNTRSTCLDSTPIIRFLHRPADPVLYRVLTRSGDEIIATGDHPFLTPEGMRPVDELQPGDRIAFLPFEGVPYEDPPDEVIVDIPDVERILQEAGKDNRRGGITKAITGLQRRGLLPLRYTSPALPYLLKLLGYAWGDGTAGFMRRRKEGVLVLYGKEEDLAQILDDLHRLGYGGYLRSRRRKVVIRTPYQVYETVGATGELEVNSTGLVALLAAMGLPLGSKTEHGGRIPEWLKRAPLWQQRLFLAAFFGAELPAPALHGRSAIKMRRPVLTIACAEHHLAEGYRFLADIAEMLERFGVRTNGIYVEKRALLRSDGSRSRILRLLISGDTENLIRLFTRVGVEYNMERRFLSLVSAQYLKRKQTVRQARQALRRAIAEAYRQGQPVQAVLEAASIPVNTRFVTRSMWEAQPKGAGLPRDFPDFPTYMKQATEGLGRSGIVWEEIDRIERVEDYKGEVYDFTVLHEDHNFVANGFVVSNCGVRLLATNLTEEQIAPHLAELATRIYHNCPSGVGSEGHVPLTARQLDEVLAEGARWALRHGYARPEDLECTEEFGCMPNADPDKATPKAKERGKDQLGTLGAGNHFIEVDVVDEIFDPVAAERMGLFKGQVAVQIHCGSRGFGHQICTDYLQRFERVIHKYGIKLPDKELMCAPIDSPEGQDYIKAMACAANFAFCNRQILAHYIRKSFEEVLKPRGIAHDVWQVYDIAHNMGKIETHEIDGQRMTVCVHRKGATRAWGPGSPGLPKKYADIGQPVLIPGSMGTASYVLLGTPGSMAQTFGSTCHGAGRVMSRAQAKREIRGEKLKAELESQGIVVRAGSMAGLAEEAPRAYKDVSRVVEVVHHAGIAKKVARLRPIAVIKG
jgi:tRNA-splicing ligase RtcB